MTSKDTFKVIIAGGCITCLKLLNMLEGFDADYILVEVHESIAPAVGASIGMFLNGLWILKLPVTRRSRRFDVPYGRQNTRDENGDVIASIDGFHTKLEER
ncbi:hypothetical protein BJY00DRAFT_313962 [Aspergillus carlsbadensis]|nr:hypothetical protein BJY00DRAFT_313962 [Aspergillus carlsbadensis]